MVDDSFYMDLCLKEAWKYQGLTYPNPAVGSLILDNFGKLVAIDTHKKAGSSHAELAVISHALYLYGDKNINKINNPKEKHKYILENHNNIFKDFTIFVTLEPCNHQGTTPPCSTLIKTLKFKRVVIGTMDPNKKASGGASMLSKSGIEISTPILKKECSELIQPFIKWQSKKSFIFFKLAKTANGVYSGGIISSLQSRKYMHKIRDRIDLIVIGGNTVRIDRPTLDSRLIHGKAPDVLIYSKNKNFDKTIPLFSVKNRKVKICDSLNDLSNYNYIMIEGGEGMLRSTLHLIDYILVYTSSNFKMGKTLQLNLKLHKLYDGKIDCDRVEWLKII